MHVCASLVTVDVYLLLSKFKKSIKYLQFLAHRGFSHHGFTTVHHKVSTDTKNPQERRLRDGADWFILFSIYSSKERMVVVVVALTLRCLSSGCFSFQLHSGLVWA
jgi:hypothetical protein